MRKVDGVVRSLANLISRFGHWPRSLLLGWLTCTFVVLMASPSAAQFSLPEGLGASEAVGPPDGVTRFGTLEVTTVSSPLSEADLFTIAAPTVYDRSPEAIGDRLPVEQRAAEIRAKLLLLLQREIASETELDLDSLVFEIAKLNNVTVIDVQDNNFPRPLILTSVTELDADFNGQPVEALAEKWRNILETELRTGIENLPANQQRVYRIVGGLMILTAIGIALKYLLHRRQRQLKHQKQTLNESPVSAAESQPIGEPGIPTPERISQQRERFIARLRTVFSLDRQLAALDLAQWLLFWALIFSWLGAILWIYLVSPYLLDQQLGLLRGVPNLLFIWFWSGLAIRLSRRLIDHFSQDREGIDLGDFIQFGDIQRRQLRASTISGAAKGLVTILILLVAALSVLETLGVPTASTVAIGSLAGLAITFGSQNLVKDLVNGFLILSEDQYAIGDVISAGGTAGLVEALNLRVTQLRSSSGNLVTIPNSSIIQVENLTRSWSRVNFSIDVAYHTDPDEALTLITSVAQSLYDDPDWREQLMGEPTVLGIDSVSHSGMTLTVWLDTQPGKQWGVGRELRLRVRRALGQHQIEIGIPHQTLAIEPSHGDDNRNAAGVAAMPQNRE